MSCPGIQEKEVYQGKCNDALCPVLQYAQLRQRQNGPLDNVVVPVFLSRIGKMVRVKTWLKENGWRKMDIEYNEHSW